MKLTKKLSKVTLKKSEAEVTGKMGASWIVHSMEHFGLKDMMTDEYGDKKRSNREIAAYKKIMTGVMMMSSGGTRVEDIEILRTDKGLKNSLGWDSIIGSDTFLKFIENRRSNAKNRKVNEAMVVKAMREAEEEEFTYDNDATYIDSNKDSAKYSYQKEKQFSGLIGCIAELGMINTVEYRRGNVSPQVGILNQLRKAVEQAKAAGKRIKIFRSDSAAHQNEIFTCCDMNDIEYYISICKNEGVMKKLEALKEYKWKTMYGRYKEQHDRQWAETPYEVSKGFTIRLLIMRWKNPAPDLFNSKPYCYQVIGTNNKEIEPMEWLEVHNGRMGSIEHINKEIKTGLGCDYTPSHDFEKNRGYFILGVLAHNMMQVMKLFYLGRSMRHWKIKRLRYRFINVCGKIVKTGRQFYCNIINVPTEVFELFRHCKSKLSMAAR